MKTLEQIEYELKAWKERLEFHEIAISQEPEEYMTPEQERRIEKTFDMAYAQAAVDSLEWTLDRLVRLASRRKGIKGAENDDNKN